MGTYRYVRWFSEVGKGDIPSVGGKGANLGEMTQRGVAVPPGFCVTAEAYRVFVSSAGLGAKIKEIIESTNCDDADDLNCKCGDIRTDLELVRVVGRALLGDVSGARLARDKAAPPAMLDWLCLPASGAPLQEYQTWQGQVLKASFGERRFVRLDVSVNDLY